MTDLTTASNTTQRIRLNPDGTVDYSLEDEAMATCLHDVALYCVDCGASLAAQPAPLDGLRELSEAAHPVWDQDLGTGRLRYPAALFTGKSADADAALAVAAVNYVRAALRAEGETP